MRLKKRIRWMIGFLLIPLFLLAMGYGLQGKKTVAPENPLGNEVYARDMYVDQGAPLSLKEDASGLNQKTALNKAEATENPENEDPEADEPEVEPETLDSKEDETLQEDGQIPASKPNENQNKIDNELLKPEKPGDMKPNRPTPVNPDSSGGNTGDGDTENVGNSEVLDPTLPGDEEISYGEDTKEEYFKTSIKSGETVDARDYGFTITHLKKDLRVIREEVYVNDQIFPQFRGRVLLEDGKNQIKVTVTYGFKDGRKRAFFKEYEVMVNQGKLFLETDLRDQTVEKDQFSFRAKANIGKNKAMLSVYQGSAKIMPTSEDQYTLTLKEGENNITLEAKVNGQELTETYSLTYIKNLNLIINTNLESKTFQEEMFTFQAALENAVTKEKFIIKFNDQTIYPQDGDTYQVKLKTGTNKIRLRGMDEKDGVPREISASYILNYVPKATEETKPVISEINITDGMRIKGENFTLNIRAKDFQGNNIFGENIKVVLNGTVIYTKDTNQYFTSNVVLQSGDNTILVKVVDSDGRENDYSYLIYCETVKDGDPVGQMTIKIDAKVLGLGMILPAKNVTVIQGESASRAVTRILSELGFTVGYAGSLDTGFYLKRLSKPGIGANYEIPEELVDFINQDGLEWKDTKYEDSLGEIDHTQGSGWMYKQNGVFNSKSLSETIFKDGDVLEIRFTLAYGKDIGGYQNGGGNYDKTW